MHALRGAGAMFSIGEDFWITDEQGNRVLLADGKVMRLRQTVELKDGSGAIVAVMRKKLMAVRETMEIERGGALAATVHKALISCSWPSPWPWTGSSTTRRSSGASARDQVSGQLAPVIRSYTST